MHEQKVDATNNAEALRTAARAAIWKAAKSLNAECSDLSWNGFNLVGDRASIREVERLMYCESCLIALEARNVKNT